MYYADAPMPPRGLTQLCAALCAVAVSTLSCAKPEPEMHEPDSKHHAHGDEHDHGSGHHGHGQGDELNEHGYKGHRFDNPEQWVERFESPEREAWQRPDALVESLALASDATIADLGAGTGYFALRFATAAPEGRVYAVDIEAAMVEWLGQRAREAGRDNLVAIHGEASDPKLPEPVDLVFMCNVFHHLADPRAYFEHVAASLRPGARVVIVDFRKQLPEDAPGPPEAMRMRVEDINAAMGAAGYTLAREDLELLEYQYILEFTRD